MGDVMNPTSVTPEDGILSVLRNEFQLSAEQLAALPPLDEVQLIPQEDSHLIMHSDMSSGTYHPYKLFIGETRRESYYVYLRTGHRGQYKIEISSENHPDPMGARQRKKGKEKIEISSVDLRAPLPWDASYFENVANLAYPFNDLDGEARRFSAAVRWYFLLGYRTGLFEEDPGAPRIKSLQDACNVLIKEDKKASEQRKQAEKKKRKKSPEATKSVTELDPHIAEASAPRRQPSRENNQLPKATPTPRRLMFPNLKTHEGGSRENEDAAKKKKASRSFSQMEPTNEESRRRAQGTQHSQRGKLEGFDGSADTQDHDQDGYRGREAVEEGFATTRHDTPGSSHLKVGDDKSLEAQYLNLWQQRADIKKRMRTIQEQMSPEAFQALREKNPHMLLL